MMVKDDSEEILHYLSGLFYECDKQQTPDWRIGKAYKKRDGSLGCPRKHFLELEPEEVALYNQRELLHSEICLEYDPTAKEDKERSKQEFESLLNKLKDDGIRFRAFGTEEYRALRVETFWDSLAQIDKATREDIRCFLIERYGCDLQLKSDKHLVSFGKHFKTGKPIILLSEHNFGVNALESVLKEYQQQRESQALQERNKAFVLDPDSLPQRLDHALGFIDIKGNRLRYFGAFLVEKIVQNKSGEEVETKKKQPVLICEDGSILSKAKTEAYFEFKSQMGVGYDRWSLQGIKQFIEGKYKPTFKAVFADYKAHFKGTMVYEHEGWYDLLAIWCMASYFQDMISKSLIIKVEGKSGTAKSKTAKSVSLLAFNGKSFLCPTPATFFRYRNNFKASLVIEEAERLFDDSKRKLQGDSDLVEYLNASYEKGNTVPRQNDKNLNQTDEFDPFGFTMIGSIKPLQGALHKRSITLYQIKAPKNDPRNDVEPDMYDERYAESRNRMYALALREHRAFKKQLDSQKQGYGLANREWQICKPLLALAGCIDHKLAERMGKFLAKRFEVRDEPLYEESWEAKLLGALIELTRCHREPAFIENKLIRERFLTKLEPSYEKISQHKVTTLMLGLGFGEQQGRNSQRTKRGFILSFWNVAETAIRNDDLESEIIVEKLSEVSEVSETGISPREFSKWYSDTFSDKDTSDDEVSDTSDRQDTFPGGKGEKSTGSIQDKIMAQIGDSERPMDEVLAGCGGDTVEPILAAMKEKGLIFEPRPGFLRRLQ